jgi:hypothetical protein
MPGKLDIHSFRSYIYYRVTSKLARGLHTVGKSRKTPIIEDVAAIVARDPDASVRGIARETGRSKSEIGRILQKPITKARVAELLAADGTGGTVRTIGTILAALSTLADDMLADGLQDDADITKFLQLLQSLTSTAERLARAGIDLRAVADPADDTALAAEIGRAYRRGLRAGLRWPTAAARRTGWTPNGSGQGGKQ